MISYKLDLSRRFPFYINKTIFRLFFIIILLIGVSDLALNYSYSGSWYSYALECPEGSYCPNPFFNISSLNPDTCEALMCESEFLYPGFKYGREDIIAKNGKALIFVCVLMAFGFNHLNYMWKKKQNDI